MLIVIQLLIYCIIKVHNGGTSSLIHLGPELKISCQALDLLFQRVDRIEKLVHRVKSDVNNIETRLDAAEISSGLPSSDLRSFFKPLFAVNNSPLEDLNMFIH